MFSLVPKAIDDALRSRI